ncbi:MAG TPA: aldo/keto reductase [Terracidiphilus sp.]
MAHNTSRRDFLSAGLLVPFAGAGAGMGLFNPSSETPAKSPVKPRYRTLGRTGLKVTTVGMGCMITSDPSVVERALDAGINYFDTARSYQHGNNERMVGAALGARRRNIVLSTKTEARDKEGAMRHLETSLRELNTDYIDIWYLHGRDNPDGAHDGLVEAQQLAKQQGKIRFTGISTHNSPRMAPWMAQKGVFDVLLAPFNFSMQPEVDQVITAASEAGMGVVAMKVMAGGFREQRPGSELYRKLSQPGTPLAALKWVIKHSSVATTIPSITDADQLEENLKAMARPFTEADAVLLSAHLERIAPLYCRMCGQCEGACRNGLPVANTLRCLMYAEGYGQFALGREKFVELRLDSSARCAECHACTVTCPHGVNVSARMRRAQELFA